MVAQHKEFMTRHATAIIAATLMGLSGAAASPTVTACTHPDDLNRTYTVANDHGTYTWNDHGIKRSWALNCNQQRDGSTACHRWEQYGETGRSVMIFRMLPDGTLIEAGAWGLLDVSVVSVTSGFLCSTQSE